MAIKPYTYRVPVSETEHEQIDRICKSKHLSRSASIRMLLTEAVREYRKRCTGNLMISLEYTDFVRYDYVQTYVPKEIYDFFCELSKAAGGLSEIQLVRHFLISKLLEEKVGD